MRGQEADYDAWGNGWSWADVLPYCYVRSENYHRGADAHHSDQGELLVQQQRLKWDILETFKKVCEESGFTDRPDFNCGDNSGVGYFEVNQKHGVRFSSARAFLHPIRHRSNLRVMTKTLSEQLIFDGERCIGMDGTQRGKPIAIRANRVILAAGTIGSPRASGTVWGRFRRYPETTQYRCKNTPSGCRRKSSRSSTSATISSRTWGYFKPTRKLLAWPDQDGVTVCV